MLTLKAALTDLVGADLDAAYQVTDKQARVVQINALRDRANAQLASDDGFSAEDIKDSFKKLEKSIVRGRIIRGEPRIDGRDTKKVRAINVEVGILIRFTVLHCLPVARLRQLLLQLWVQPVMHR